MSNFRHRFSANSRQATSLDSLRLRIYLSVYPFGFVALCIITITEYILQLASPIQLIAHPLLIVLFTIYGVILYVRRSWLRLLEITSFVTVALYMLIELYALLYQIYFHGGSQTLTTFPQWLPMIYILAFLMFETRTAVVLSIGFLSIAILPTAIYLLLYGVGGLRNEAFLLLFQIYFSHATYIPLLSGISVIKARYVRAAILAESMVQVANRDYLTNTDSRRYLEQTLTLALERARRYNRSLMVLVIDIDYFKRVNDNYGHNAGDDVLIEFAGLIRQHLRTADSFGRWGGEEFLVIAPEIDQVRAVLLAERLRAIVAQHAFRNRLRLTASFGVTGYRPNDTIDSIVKRADIALYRAKQRGRDRIELQS